MVPFVANSIRLDGCFLHLCAAGQSFHTLYIGCGSGGGQGGGREHLFIHGLISLRDGGVEASPDGAKRARQSHPASARA
jgi:hypothetical protein